ncbi:CHAD domain-containing protein [Calothrix parasitica NIES-267]|uniref:CHAD domain-containing protein n=1 Tax=Calothrix parasitica NIES-267 TaxID=1973488 RepID=A0A1Z4LRA7_9CYAN|nr:CHAD domain-containing protein [Calothrix parasitica NIES-267]
MTLATKPTVKTLANSTYNAIEKHFNKTCKWEKAVKNDKDAEALHQMRVGMRRLRTTVTRFNSIVNFPKAANDKSIGKIARGLGSLRDLDVLKETLKNKYQPELPKKEKAILDKVINTLEKQRIDALTDVKAIFKSERYKSLKTSLKEWLEKPSYQPLADLTIQQALPDLLLPEVSSFLLHPGWLVGTKVQENKVVISTDFDEKKVDKQLLTSSEKLHDLRKQAKGLRYQMELFTNLYGEGYANYLAQIKETQEVLGSMQDSIVLGEWLEDVLESKISKQLPTLATLLAKNRYEKWQEWQSLQERFLKLESRHEFHLIILHPDVNG